MLKRISNFGSCDILHRAAPTGTPPPHPHPAYSTVVPHPTSGSSNIRVIQHQGSFNILGHSTSGSFNIRVIRHQGHSTSGSFDIDGHSISWGHSTSEVIQHRGHSTSASFNIGGHSTSEVIQHHKIIKNIQQKPA